MVCIPFCFSHIQRNANHNSSTSFYHLLKHQDPLFEKLYSRTKKHNMETSKENWKHFEILIVKENLSAQRRGKYIVGLCKSNLWDIVYCFLECGGHGKNIRKLTWQRMTVILEHSCPLTSKLFSLKFIIHKTNDFSLSLATPLGINT